MLFQPIYNILKALVPRLGKWRPTFSVPWIHLDALLYQVLNHGKVAIEGSYVERCSTILWFFRRERDSHFG